MSSLLPDPERSRAVLVGSDAGLPEPHYLDRPEKDTSMLADALTGVFGHVDVVLGHRPEEALAAVRQAGAAATDVLFSTARTTTCRPWTCVRSPRSSSPRRPLVPSSSWTAPATSAASPGER